ncbi:MAG: protein translocase subunit SecD [Rhodospirillales bacterium]|nr:protein translocase subunit SecD [Alphaproteobacteria bacterium]MCB9986013.1 protein translocase subunit SecD [Rhodospirillales bacterium]USO07412.1 MAG: protein translocase subunit SecD [Rhodospirillales bacterium]
MIRIPLWKVALILLVCLAGFIYAAPNLMTRAQADAWAAKVPSFVPSRTVNLGLDLQGGSYLMLQVGLDDAIHDQADNAMQAARSELRTRKIGYSSLRVTPTGFVVVLRNPTDTDAARSAFRKADPELDLTDDGHGTITAVFSEAKLKAIKDHAIEQSIEIVRRRVDETGTREPSIAREGEDRIVVQLPGLGDPEHVKNLLGKTAKLGFQLVDSDAAMTGKPGLGDVMLPMQEYPGQSLPVQKNAMITGDMLVNAQPSFNQNGQPVVTFQLNTLGAKRFCDVTTQNVGKPFAIVLDNVVISAPRINEPICGGSGQISGSFTVQTSSDLALLLRAGALPAPLKIVEERTVGPTLGSDSVAAGKKACVMALVFVIVFACTVYGLFGVFASLALLMNMVLLIAVMSMLQATLTLPGIAGIVLAIGLAVDGNVLVFERIKEELRAGRSILAAVDTGYERAKTTIIDSNLTALISALILFSFGTGPIKGFAVTTSIGVGTAYFASMMLTRLMVVGFLRWKKPKAIAV